MNCVDGTYKKGTEKWPLFHAILKYRYWLEGGSCLIIHFILGEKANYSELKGFNMQEKYENMTPPFCEVSFRARPSSEDSC